MLRHFTVKIIITFLILGLSNSIQAQVTANFSANVTQGCTPVLIQFTDMSTSTATGIASWHWDFGDATTTNIQNPAKVFNSAGSFTVCLIVTDSLGTSDTLCLNNYINVSSSPTAEFEGIPTAGCAPVSVQFNDLSTAGSNPINNWQWTFGTGASSIQQNPQFTYSSVNNYTVSLTVTDANGCSDQIVKSSYIEVAGIPTANFQAATAQFCSTPATANFANTTVVPTGANMEYKWYFGDGDSSSAINPSHTYNNPGNYDVTLIATDTSSTTNCSDTITIGSFIQVFNSASISFSNSPSQGCDNVNVQFTNTTSCPSSNWSWDFGDNTTSNLENPSHTYSTPGTYDVIFSALVDGVPLSDTCFSCVTVDITPSVDYTTTGTIATCNLPINASFAGTSNNPNVTYSWDFGDMTTSNMQNPSHTWTTGGTYPVSLTVTSPEGCSNTIVKDTVFARPIIANYIENRVSSCVGGEVEFIDSTLSFYPITNWNWDFTDTTSIDQNPRITFNDTGSYQVTLIVTNTLGCSDTLINTIEVGDSVTIDFSADDSVVCVDQDINFNNLTDTATINLVSEWTWDFGDGNTSNVFEPIHAYSDTGTYTVVLIASYNNCDSRVEKVDFITVGPPKSDFEADRDCAAPLQVTFIDKSEGADTYSWDFGVPSLTNDTSNLANPVYTYPSAGTYTIKLTVTNSTTGCSHEEMKTLILNPSEDVTVTLSDSAGCSPLVINVSNTSSLATYAWTANGATINDSTLAQPTLTYSLPGVYDSITLVVTHPSGCIEEIIMPDSIKVSDISASLSVNTTSGCAPLTVNFTDLSFTTANVASYTWDFGNGDSSTVQNPSYTYNNAGAFTPSLTITDTVGCTKTATLNTSIIPTSPGVDFLSDTLACVGQSISFANLSTGVGLSHSWDFGDMNTSNQVSPTYTYTSEGTYNACLTVTDINNCSNTFCRTIVIANPVANFSANNTSANCQALSVQFNDLSQNAISWQWDFGDSTGSGLQNPVKIYSQPGNYDVTLIVTSQSGCQDTITQAGFITISGPSGDDFTFTPNSGCPGTNVSFSATGQNVTKFIFVWGDFTTTEITGTGGNDTINTNHVYQNGGIFHPALVVEDASGCQITYLASDSITIEDFGVDIVKSDATLCDSGLVSLSANISSLTPVTFLQWTHGNPSQNNSNNSFNVNITTPGVYPISLTASNASCTRTTVDSIVVNNSPNVNYGISPQQACTPQMVMFTDSSTILNDTIISYAWDLGIAGITDSVPNTSYLFDTVGSFNIELKATSANGCVDSLIQVVDIFANPVADAGTDTTICEGDNYQLLATGGATYNWNADPSLSCLNCPNPIASPTTTTDYIVTVTNANGCTDLDTIRINVNPKPLAEILNLPMQACEDETVSATGGNTIASGSIISWDWDFGNTMTSNMQSISVAYPTAGNYAVSLIVHSNLGCSDTISSNITINPSPTATANFNTFICQGDNAVLVAGGGVSYQWSPSATLNCDTCQVVVAMPTVTTTYTLTATSNNGCTDTDTVRVEVSPFPNPTLILSNDTTICMGDVIQLQASGGTSVLDYNWDISRPGLSCYQNCNNPFASPNTTTTYVVTLTGPGGCSTTDSVTVTVITPNSDIVAQDTLTICSGDSIQLNTILGTNHQWSPFDNLSCVVCPDPMAFPSQTTTYTVTAEEAGCIISDAITVNVIDLEDFSAGDDKGLCLGQSVQLDGTGFGIVTWSPTATLDNPNILTPIATPTQNTTYTISIDNGVCVVQDSMTVFILPGATLDVEDVEICAGESIVLPVTSLGSSFLWTPADSLSSDTVKNPVANPTQTTTYSVTAFLQGCNSTTKELTVTVFDVPDVSGFPIQEAFTGVNAPVALDVEVNPTYNYQWWHNSSDSLLSCTNCPDPTLLAPTQDATVYIQVTNLDGCTVFDSIQIQLINECEENLIVVPNAFTPNGDGLNDILYVRGSGIQAEGIITFQVFARNGERLYSSSDINFGWDGTYNGRELNTGVYVYFVEAICPITNTIVRKQGNVMLIRN
jgi:gliding motility-associated-like protein